MHIISILGTSRETWIKKQLELGQINDICKEWGGIVWWLCLSSSLLHPEVACVWGSVYFTFQPRCLQKSLSVWSWCLRSSFGVCAKMAASFCWYYCPCPWQVKTGLGEPRIYKGRGIMIQEPSEVEKRGTIIFIWKQASDPVLQFDPDHLGIGKTETQIQTFYFQVYIFIRIHCGLNEYYKYTS